jgi:hypothetical protein
VSQALQILTVAIAIGVFFVVFGALAVPSSVREAWEVTEGGTLVPTTRSRSSPITLHLAGERIAPANAAMPPERRSSAAVTSFAARAEYVRMLEAG